MIHFTDIFHAGFAVAVGLVFEFDGVAAERVLVNESTNIGRQL